MALVEEVYQDYREFSEGAIPVPGAQIQGYSMKIQRIS